MEGCFCSLRNKISDLHFSLHDTQLEYIGVSEIRVESFPSAEFAIENFEVQARRPRIHVVENLSSF